MTAASTSERLDALKADLRKTTNGAMIVSAHERLIEWLGTEHHALERNDCSRMHKLVEALRDGRACDAETIETIDAKELMAYLPGLHPFVVKHDWDGAFGGAIGTVADDIRMPYEECAFEFRISGRTVIVVVFQNQRVIPGASGIKMAALAFVESEDVWLMFGKQASEFSPLQFAWRQIVAVAVALDSEVAIHDVVRAPSALNRKRERAGALPLFDYHVVNLARRHRVAGMPSIGDHSRRHRLHFRRGHWRHLEARKTWINWMLVGDPDLGFIGKHYSL